MKQFTAIVHKGGPDEGGFWATCLEVPGANGQGETKQECLDNLKQAIQLLLDTEHWSRHVSAACGFADQAAGKSKHYYEVEPANARCCIREAASGGITNN
jgi:predicted RNase H-like HicB family nuclease